MVKCIAYKASPHSHISEPVHDIWLVFPPTWTTREICKQRGLALREINGPRAGNRVTLATLEKYIDGQCHLWKDLQSKGKMMEEIFAYWSMGNHSGLYMIVLNFRLTKTSCLWPIKHAFTSALAIKNYIKKSEWNNCGSDIQSGTTLSACIWVQTYFYITENLGSLNYQTWGHHQPFLKQYLLAAANFNLMVLRSCNYEIFILL